MIEMGEIIGFDENGGIRTAAIVTTERGDTVTAAYDRRHRATNRDGDISFEKKPKHLFDFPNTGDQVALRRTPCGKQAERWGVIATNPATIKGNGGNIEQ